MKSNKYLYGLLAVALASVWTEANGMNWVRKACGKPVGRSLTQLTPEQYRKYLEGVRVSYTNQLVKRVYDPDTQKTNCRSVQPSDLNLEQLAKLNAEFEQRYDYNRQCSWIYQCEYERVCNQPLVAVATVDGTGGWWAPQEMTVVAKQDLPKGMLVGELTGVLTDMYPIKPSGGQLRDVEYDSAYPVELVRESDFWRSKTVVSSEECGNEYKHLKRVYEDPNVEVVLVWGADQVPHLALFTTKHVYKGQELTVKEAWEGYAYRYSDQLALVLGVLGVGVLVVGVTQVLDAR